MNNLKTKHVMRLPIIFATIPVVFFTIEVACLVYFSVAGLFVNLDAAFVVTGVLSIIGMFVVPFASWILEIIGLIVSIKRRLKKFIIIFPIEIILTIVSLVLYYFFFKVWIFTWF